MKLYFYPQSRAVIAKWMLDKCGAADDIVPIDLERREHKTPAFLKINPAGKLPTLVDGDARAFENAATGLYLAEKFPEAGLAPNVDSPAHGRFLSLMVYRRPSSNRPWETACSNFRRRPRAAGTISK